MNQLKSLGGVGVIDGTFSKFDAGLRKAIAESKMDPNREWPVMILFGGEISGQTGTKPPAEFAKEALDAFEQDAMELIQMLRKLSSQPVQIFWINCSLAASLPLDALVRVANRTDVQQIMLMIRHKALI